MIAWLAFIVAGAVVMTIVAVALFGWGGALSRWQRYGLLSLASGLAWAGPARFMGHPPGTGDILFLAGLLAYLIATYGRSLYGKADALDGRQDGHFDLRRVVRWGPH